ncbi:MAG: hypothetical protein HZC15_04040 [Candidatus Omnitrophica bacterium]|nr:hypothetical protein [Candidatus Omnitrophota bacterium]
MTNLFIVSQNLTKSNMKFPENTILRVNLAWHKDLDSVAEMLNEYDDHDIFLDIPVGRIKPPNHNHRIDDIMHIVNNSKNVKYVAISNVEDTKELSVYCKKFNAKIVPKIETLKGVNNLSDIVNVLEYSPKIIMLDHEDLYSNLVNLRKEEQYLDVMDRVVRTCEQMDTIVLRVKGIIFTSN